MSHFNDQYPSAEDIEKQNILDARYNTERLLKLKQEESSKEIIAEFKLAEMIRTLPIILNFTDEQLELFNRLYVTSKDIYVPNTNIPSFRDILL